MSNEPLKTQVGGSHYKDFEIQPVEFCQKNKLRFCESSIIKYICRHRTKNGMEDLQKAKHFIDMLIAMEYKGVENLKKHVPVKKDIPPIAPFPAAPKIRGPFPWEQQKLDENPVLPSRPTPRLDGSREVNHI